MEKICFKCHESKSLDEFYAHPEMADGHLNKCKDCAKKDVISNRSDNVLYYRAYDVKRMKTPKGLARLNRACKRYRKANPRKYAAHSLLYSAIKSRRIFRKPCEKCGSEKSHAHHENYDQPLEVVWLCAVCHSKRHKEMKAQGIEA